MSKNKAPKTDPLPDVEAEEGHAYAWGGGSLLAIILIVVLLLIIF